MRIAFADLVFAWPPTGGAQADLFHVMAGLHRLGYEVHLFAASYDFLWRFGTFEPETLPFPSTRIPFTRRTYTPRELAKTFRRAIDAWQPDIVFIGLGRTLKPYLIDALAHRPILSRYYMYEHLCIRDFTLFYDEETCPNDFFRTPDACRRCAWKAWKRETLRGGLTTYADEYHRAGAHTRAYHRLFVSSMGRVRTAIVSNELARQRLQGHSRDVRIIPGGVHIHEFAARPEPRQEPGKRKVILMSGRVDDSRKGVDVLLAAAYCLSKTRDDFEVWVTHSEPIARFPWLRSTGFIPHSQVPELYRQADICVVPSLWDEPFGLVAVEAMAAGLPVCASRCGGLAGIVRHGETGYLFASGDSAELALYLDRLLNDPELRRTMGEAGRRRAEMEYDWNKILTRHYVPLIEETVL